MIIQVIRCKRSNAFNVVEMVERKGVGHPDSLADLIAETLSDNFSKYCLNHLGFILNHWFDKVTLSGAKSSVTFGKAEVIKPITAYLFGKATTEIGLLKIPLRKIFKDSVEAILLEIFNDKELLKHIRYIVDINDGVGSDHPKEFYTPSNPKSFKQILQNFESNDTVLCSAYAPHTEIEQLAIDLENYINSKNFKMVFPETGWDVKVMITKVKSAVDITVCIPFIARLTPSLEYYQKQLNLIHTNLEKKVRTLYKNRIQLHLNTKDKGKFAYLTVFGTALDKGDYGCVGRGNRFNGIIAINREMNIEASAGKNPVHHTGKLYNILANKLSLWLYTVYGIKNEINISTQNGNLLTNPEFVIVKAYTKKPLPKKAITKKVKSLLDSLSIITRQTINQNPIEEFKKEGCNKNL